MYCPRKRIIYRFIYSLDKKSRLLTFWLTLLFLSVFVIWNQDIDRCQGWPEIKTRLFSDECFSVVESDAGTRKRHCPHHDLNGKLDEEQLIYMTGTFNAIRYYISID